MTFENWLKNRQNLVEEELKSILDSLKNKNHQELLSAMRYGVLDGGKRVRPLLLFSLFESFKSFDSKILKPACCLELIHCYSLIHDDLPAMDDDDFRRGKLSFHKKFGEAKAILTGDILQTLAFSVLNNSDFSDKQKVALNKILANASNNMVFGQALDLQFENKNIDLATLTTIHKCKTGSLITASLLMGGVIADVDEKNLKLIEKIGNDLGLIFKIKDDSLDVTSDTETLGKPTGSDENKQKSTFVSILGLENSKVQLEKHYQSAVKNIKKLISQENLVDNNLLNLAKLMLKRVN